MEADPRLRRDAPVVRFGIMDPAQLRRSIEAARADPGCGAYELSFFGGNDLTPEDVARIAARPNRKMRVSTVGRFRDAGWEPFVDEPPAGHLTLRFESNPDDDDVLRLIALFDDPVDNPHPFP